MQGQQVKVVVRKKSISAKKLRRRLQGEMQLDLHRSGLLATVVSYLSENEQIHFFAALPSVL
jgi:hypothetical protein